MGIVSNILQTTFELIAISHQMVEALMLPHYPSPAKKSIDGMRRSTLPRTDNALHHIPVCRSHQDMHMIGHDDKGIYLVFYAVGMHHDVCKDISDTLVFEYACSIAGIYPSIYDSTEAIVIVLLYGGIPWFGMCIQPLFTLQPIFLQLGLRKRVGKTESDKLHTIVLIPMRDSCSRNMDVFSSVDELQRIVSHITYFCFVLFIIGVAEAGSGDAVVVGAASSLHTPAVVSAQAGLVFVACLRRSEDASHYYSLHSCLRRSGDASATMRRTAYSARPTFRTRGYRRPRSPSRRHRSPSRPFGLVSGWYRHPTPR